MTNQMTGISNKANGLASEFKNKAHQTEEQLEKISHEIGERMGAKASEIAETTKDYVLTGRQYVQANPIRGVAIAAVAGIALGSLLTMALRRR